jgi:hypothetical protein
MSLSDEELEKALKYRRTTDDLKEFIIGIQDFGKHLREVEEVLEQENIRREK